jgi:DNA uptake protein ComE-like DNA-binding protein
VERVERTLANPLELLELPGLDSQQAHAIVSYRAEHGPIRDVEQLLSVLGAGAAAEVLSDAVDFSPAEATAPEAPGA